MNNEYIWLIIKNIIAIICFTILSIVFNKWWIIFFSIIFITTFSTKNDNGGSDNE